jgi:hypothetical protein
VRATNAAVSTLRRIGLGCAPAPPPWNEKDRCVLTSRNPAPSPPTPYEPLGVRWPLRAVTRLREARLRGAASIQLLACVGREARVRNDAVGGNSAGGRLGRMPRTSKLGLDGRCSSGLDAFGVDAVTWVRPRQTCPQSERPAHQ